MLSILEGSTVFCIFKNDKIDLKLKDFYHGNRKFLHAPNEGK
jgi:hypothetical protein